MSQELDLDNTTPLKDMSNHVFHGRISIGNESQIDKALELVTNSLTGVDDVMMWHGWDTDTVYEIFLSSTTASGIRRCLDAVRSRQATHLYAAVVPAGVVIEYYHWRPYDQWQYY